MSPPISVICSQSKYLNQAALDARILACFADLEDLDALNDANASTMSPCTFPCFTGSLADVSIRCCIKRTALA